MSSERQDGDLEWVDDDGHKHAHCSVCGDCYMCGRCLCEILEDDKTEGF